MWNTAKELLKSKKAIVAFVAMVVWCAGRFGVHLEAKDLTEAVAPLWAYIVAQGVADHGKEAAQIANSAGTPPAALPTDGK